MDYKDKAIELHLDNPVVDAHLDLAGEIYNRNMNGEHDIINRYYLNNFKKAGINIVVSSIYIDNAFLPELGLKIALGQINALMEDVDKTNGEVIIAKSKKDLNNAIKKGKIAVMISFEGLDPIGNDIGLLRPFYELGVRGAGITWSRRNCFADGSMNWVNPDEKGQDGGLTNLGVATIRRLEELNMFIDVSHLNDAGFWDVVKFAKKPIIASHSDSRTVHNHLRNLTDEQLVAIAKNGGVVGINAFKQIAGVEKNDNPILKLCDHIEYMVKLIGCEHVGYGFDLCNSYYDSEMRFEHEKADGDSLRDHSEMLLITEELLKRGLTDDEVKLIIGGNFVRFYNEILK